MFVRFEEFKFYQKKNPEKCGPFYSYFLHRTPIFLFVISSLCVRILTPGDRQLGQRSVLRNLLRERVQPELTQPLHSGRGGVQPVGEGAEVPDGGHCSNNLRPHAPAMVQEKLLRNGAAGAREHNLISGVIILYPV